MKNAREKMKKNRERKTHTYTYTNKQRQKNKIRTQFDGGSIVELLLGVLLSAYTGETLDEGGLSVGDMTTDADRDGGKQ
jgi:hypothetical protein